MADCLLWVSIKFMSLVAESFGGYVERRRTELYLTQRRQRWMFLTCLLAIYLWPFYLLGVAVFPAPLTSLGIALSGLSLYVGGSYLVSNSSSKPQTSLNSTRAEAIWQFTTQTVLVPHLAIVVSIWLGLALWGEVLVPVFNRQVPQLIAGIILSSVLAGGHFWRTLQLWPLEGTQLWQDYLADLRGVLRAYYQQLEDARRSLNRYTGLNDDLQLEALEARQLLREFTGPLGLDSVAETLTTYVRSLEDSQHNLAQLLPRLEASSLVLESSLMQLESYLDIQSETALHLDSIEFLGDLYLEPFFQLGGELEAAVDRIAGVAEELEGLQHSISHA
ncbi:MAG: hypothetical protein AAF974_03995 [Cyanobacteria bacterium P01_E01_bin.34]